MINKIGESVTDEDKVIMLLACGWERNTGKDGKLYTVYWTCSRLAGLEKFTLDVAYLICREQIELIQAGVIEPLDLTAL